MMLFGGNLSGFKTTETAKKKATAQCNSEDSKPLSARSVEVTPHSDLISRLTEQEQRLLDELNRTRSKLTTEWKLKAEDMKAMGLDLPLDKLLLLQSGNQEDKAPPPRRQAGMRKASLRRTSSDIAVPAAIPTGRQAAALVLRHSFDMLPILTTTGETPFEVGLDKPSGQQQHVLPVFKLPSVLKLGDRRSAIVEIESHRSEDEKSQDNEAACPAKPNAVQGMTDAEKEEAMRVLGLTEDEINSLDTGSTPSSLAPHSMPSVLSTASLLSTTTIKPPQRQGSHATNGKWAAKRKQTKHSRHRRDVDSDELQVELRSALRNVQTFTSMVKRDIANVQKICPVNSIRGDMFVKKWGLEKLNGICTRLFYAKLHAAFDRWQSVAVWTKQQEARQALMQFRGTKKLDLYFSNWTKRKLAAAWDKWMSILWEEKAQHQAELELDATLCLQRAYRAYTKRKFYRFIRNQQREKQRNAAARTIQALCRGRFARQTAARLVRDIRRGVAAIKIQARARGMLTRQSLVGAKHAQQQHKAAARVQSLHRGRMGRRRVAQLRREAAMRHAATVIQRRYRGRLHNAKQIRMMIDRERRRQAIKIQALYRGTRGRNEVGRVKARRAQHAQQQQRSALKIQSVYRGHRGRVSTHIKMAARREYLKRRSDAAITIQSLVRGRLAKKTVMAERVARLNDMVANARLWTQFWSDDANAFFFYNNATGEAIWEPPEGSVGYTKMDGQLVLGDGSVIPDPAIQAAQDAEAAAVAHAEVEDEATEEAQCVECEEADATRRCLQCEDVFCDACYDRTHGTGKRAQHTWKAMGPVKCVECEKMRATRWCEQCYDPYCLGCFTIIHAKGNKALHTWKEMSRSGKIVPNVEDAQTYNEFVASNEYNYINEGIANQEYGNDDTSGYTQDTYGAYTEPAPDVAYGYDQDGGGSYEQEAASDWIATVDDVSGELYYYNTVTGETQWAQ
ncbi:Aste57867_8610 [Aphanomyces stellatus]|uniref:Aste57867_8610 protein n=1 Tax=Aphanomyces stellatus TaxID=120398 RepID=A0A485KKS0_9STRA|nr:hypothetical protein As57867_008576 [Aphanomyces stellatus]VFT85496.1 Aste57867_8610 [Aphanomyces stellatus]